ncbi:MAG TPA: Holliday junction resolvase RuvX, partial [Phycisphaerae bacterium]|nr:Holliday junction resolvase RuvX [Phycisphaerae bacterium]
MNNDNTGHARCYIVKAIMGRWLGLDYGTVRIGVAVGSSGDGIASPTAVIQAEPVGEFFEQIRKLVGEYEAEGIVVGWPLNMDDTEGPQGKLTRLVAVKLASALEMDVRLWDERLSSFEADTKMAGLYTRKK